MPVDSRGRQLITFATEAEQDRRYIRYVWVPVRPNDTVKKIAARYGHPEDVRIIADMNGIGSVTKKLSRKRVKVPGSARPSGRIQVMAGEEAPQITGGYSKFSTLDRPARTGLTKFDGYDPVTMAVAIQFENWSGRDGSGIEGDIAQLERMAGRGDFKGAAVGPPAVIHVSTTNASGTVIPLIPLNYQRYPQNPSGPLWRVTNIEWDANPLRDSKGRRTRQKAVVTLQQHTRVSTAVQNRSASERARYRKSQRAASKAADAAEAAARRAARRT